MSTRKYYLHGDRDILPGITGMVVDVDDEGKVVAGCIDAVDGFMAREVSKEEFEKTLTSPELMTNSALFKQKQKEAALLMRKALVMRDLEGLGNFDEPLMMSVLAATYQTSVKFVETVREEFKKVFDDYSRDDMASIWAVYNSPYDDVLNGGKLPEGQTMINGVPIEAGNLGNIQTKSRKVEVMNWFNMADQFDPSMTNVQYAEKIIELRDQLRFTGKPS